MSQFAVYSHDEVYTFVGPYMVPFQSRRFIAEIQQIVAQHFNIPLAEMSSARRSRCVARPRQVAMYLSKRFTPRSLPEIGRKFGNRDHTTVIHALRQIEHLRAIDGDLNRDLQALERRLAA